MKCRVAVSRPARFTTPSRCLAWSAPGHSRAAPRVTPVATCASRGFRRPRRESPVFRRVSASPRVVRAPRADRRRGPTADDECRARARHPFDPVPRAAPRPHPRRARSPMSISRLTASSLVASALASSPRLVAPRSRAPRFRASARAIDKYVFLRRLQQENAGSFYRLLMQQRDGDNALRVHPTVGEACETYHRLPIQTRGVYITADDAAKRRRRAARARSRARARDPLSARRRRAQSGGGDGRRAHLGAGRPRRRRHGHRGGQNPALHRVRGIDPEAVPYPCVSTWARTIARCSTTPRTAGCAGERLAARRTTRWWTSSWRRCARGSRAVWCSSRILATKTRSACWRSIVACNRASTTTFRARRASRWPGCSARRG